MSRRLKTLKFAKLLSSTINLNNAQIKELNFNKLSNNVSFFLL